MCKVPFRAIYPLWSFNFDKRSCRIWIEIVHFRMVVLCALERKKLCIPSLHKIYIDRAYLFLASVKAQLNNIIQTIYGCMCFDFGVCLCDFVSIFKNHWEVSFLPWKSMHDIFYIKKMNMMIKRVIWTCGSKRRVSAFFHEIKIHQSSCEINLGVQQITYCVPFLF